ncbi:hypothetical protein [Natrinema salsiterrestre]|uniref:Uncharacterized protein n=1 Tax=Natrinema salsiterrestre TaxID=2950540 RepID=A0A9Q4Q0U5_9EURY|nr:hypothetical protein [Natrinema salsiterrestre]MDF9744721.1 hypothetical protein [Natrinema salsiterrestre]
MTANHETDAPTESTLGEVTEIEDLESMDVPTGRIATVASDAIGSETVSLLGGGLLLAAAIRSLAADRSRAIPLAIAGSGLVGFGLHRRRSSDESSRESHPDVEGGTEGKEMSDQASAAAERVDSGRESEIGADGEISDERGIDAASEADSEPNFTDEPDEDPTQSGPTLDESEETDPRRETDAEGTEIDVSDSAMADETSEATGPTPEQAQPTQTADTEPEESPAQDASEMKVEPPDEGESDSKSDGGDTAGEEDATGNDESDESDR